MGLHTYSRAYIRASTRFEVILSVNTHYSIVQLFEPQMTLKEIDKAVLDWVREYYFNSKQNKVNLHPIERFIPRIK